MTQDQADGIHYQVICAGLFVVFLMVLGRFFLSNSISFRQSVKQQPLTGAYYRLHDSYVQEARLHHALHHFFYQDTHGLNLLTDLPMYCNVCNQLVVRQTVLCCEACRYVVHESCLRFADRNCKLIFLPPARNGVLAHQWIKGTHVSSQPCAFCGLGCSSFFGQIGVHCAWCHRNAHQKCLEGAVKQPPADELVVDAKACDLGPFRRLIVDPSRVKPLMPAEPTNNGLLQRSLKYVQHSGESMGRTLRRQLSRGAKRPVPVKPTSPARLTSPAPLEWSIGPSRHPYLSNPLLVLINMKSGGSQGKRLRHDFMRYLHPLQVWDLGEKGALYPLRIFQDVPGHRILACGGDGTAAWVLSSLDELPQHSYTPPVGILPLGTGNDLAVCLKWGGGYRGEDVAGILRQVQHASPCMLDRWQVDVGTYIEHTEGVRTFEPRTQKLMMNYLGIGMDAEIAFKFHSLRTQFPSYFTSQIRNKIWYGQLGAESYFFPSDSQSLSSVSVRVDGCAVDLTGLEGVVCANITSYAGGAYLWGANNSLLEASLALAGHEDDQWEQEKKRSSKFVSPAFDDVLMEVVGIRNSLHMVQVQLGLARGIRLGQGKVVEIKTSKSILIQVDGEPWPQRGGVVIRITHRNQALMLARSPHVAEAKSAADHAVLDGFVNVLQWAESTNVISKEQRLALLAELGRRELRPDPRSSGKTKGGRAASTPFQHQL
eukprot:gb/GEZN01002810.1/.p1 GENE.gb/GEZN01002810.1/~~gb/GEZN01002810.1/.p1  ORF type:complete len:711 (-),score=72.63 gb/GEZN01002810.1/:6-2138(-)